MYLKSHGKNIVLREGTINAGSLSGLGWPAILSVTPPTQAPPPASAAPQDPFAQLRSQTPTPTSPSPWGALAAQAQGAGGVIGNLLQGGIDALRNLTGGGSAPAASAPSAPIMVPQPQQGSGMMPVLLLGGVAVAAVLLLKKRKKG